MEKTESATTPVRDATQAEREHQMRRALHERISHDFTFHKPANDSSIVRHRQINEALSETAHLIVELTPLGREQSTAITKLEEARFWANAAIARAEGH